MGAYEILFQVFTALNRKSHLAVGIHDIHLSDGREAMIGGGFQMAVGIRASASVSRVTFHDRTVYFLYQVFDKCRLQEVMASRLSGRELHRHFPLGLPSQGVVETDHVLRSDIFQHIYLRNSGRGFAFRNLRPHFVCDTLYRYRTCHHPCATHNDRTSYEVTA